MNVFKFKIYLLFFVFFSTNTIRTVAQSCDCKEQSNDLIETLIYYLIKGDAEKLKDHYYNKVKRLLVNGLDSDLKNMVEVELNSNF